MEASFARSILVDAPVAVVAIDGRGAVRVCNATAEALFGGALTGDDPVFIQSLIEGFHLTGDSAQDDVNAFNLKSHSAESTPMHTRALNGATIPVDVQAARFSTAGEDFLTLFVQDVTAVIGTETALQELRHQITHNWRLNSLGEMASMLAHELNQPLSAIANHLYAARSLLNRDEPEIEAAKRSILLAEAQTQRTGDTIRRLRALMSRDTGFHAPEIVAEVVDEVLPILNINAREFDAEIISEIAADDQTDCDRIQLQQLIFNLVRNAIEAPSNGLRRQIRISGNSLGSGAYRLVVEDNGPGVAPEIRNDLFGPLASTKPNGMGLGLSICRTIAEAHGGALTYEKSALGGAAFILTLNDTSPKGA